MLRIAAAKQKISKKLLDAALPLATAQAVWKFIIINRSEHKVLEEKWSIYDIVIILDEMFNRYF